MTLIFRRNMKMKDKNSVHITVVAFVSIAIAALAVMSIVSGWELWMTLPISAAAVGMWVIHLRQAFTPEIREVYYLVVAMAGLFFHGVHQNGFFDLVAAVCPLIVLFALLGSTRMLTLLLLEYIVLLLMQLTFITGVSTLVGSFGEGVKLIYHILVVFSVYIICCLIINQRNTLEREIEKENKDLSAAEEDTDDFLSNISHELRTPVNVVNGMSELILKKGESEDVTAINEAGKRLSNQIENIQDYTEIKKGQVIIEEDRYMIVSLLNDIISSLKLRERGEELEFVIDLDPNVPSMMVGDVKKLYKIMRHLIDNAVKFTPSGGVYIGITAERRDYGANLVIDITDTGIGMSRKVLESASNGLYQADKKRNRQTGGIGLGLNIVHGFAHWMGGFVKIKSEKGEGTKVRVVVPQKVIDSSPCLTIDHKKAGCIIFHVWDQKFKVPKVRDFYRDMAVHIAQGFNVELYAAVDREEVEASIKNHNVTHIFMGTEEYQAMPEYFDELAKKDITVAVSADPGLSKKADSLVITMPKPIYGFPVAKILNGLVERGETALEEKKEKVKFDGVRALIVDDEPMNLVVATGLFKDYRMITDTAGSGNEAIQKVMDQDFDVIFMDHMMPEMDGIEAMKRIRDHLKENGKAVKMVALTANAVSGAREMFMNEGFDGFISKPIDTTDFERVMKKLLYGERPSEDGGVFV